MFPYGGIIFSTNFAPSNAMPGNSLGDINLTFNSIDRRNALRILYGSNFALATCATFPSAAKPFRWNRPKGTAGYQEEPNGKEQCSRCKLYEAPKNEDTPGGCFVIEGPIVPKGRCRLWKLSHDARGNLTGASSACLWSAIRASC